MRAGQRPRPMGRPHRDRVTQGAPSRWPALRASLAVMLLASRAWGQESAESGQRPRERAPVARVTALPLEELPEDPSAFTSVIEAQEFAGEARSTADLLAGSVGVHVRRFGGPGQLSELSIRGSTSQQVVVLLDGVRLNSAQSGTVDLSTLPLHMIERIEVVRGGGSLQVGSDAIGGVVNVVTRRPSDTPSISASVGAGSHDTWQGSLSFSGPLAVAGVELALGYSGFKTDGDFDFQTAEIQAGPFTSPSRKLRRINNQSESHALTVKASLDVGDRVRIALMDSLFYQSRGLPGRDVGTANLGFQNPRAHERVTRNVSDALVELSDLWDGRLLLEAGLSHRYERTRFRDPTPRLGDPSQSLQKNRASAARARGELSVSGLGLDHVVSLRLDLRRDTLQATDFEAQHRWSFGAAIQDEVSLFGGLVELIPGIRYDRSEGFGSEWMPRIGAVLSPVGWLRFKANAERSYRVPNFDELFFPDKGFIRGNPALRPEKAWNFDGGVELGVSRLGPLQDARLEASVFYNDISNSIVFQEVSVFTLQATNTGDATILGVELAAAIGWRGWLALSGNWTHLDTDRKSSGLDTLLQQSGGELPGRPDDETTLRLRIGPPSALWKLVGEQHYTSSIPLSFSGDSRVGSRTVYAVRGVLDLAQVDWLPRLSHAERLWPQEILVSFGVTNLTDRSVRDAAGFPQPGRSWSAALEATW